MRIKSPLIKNGPTHALNKLKNRLISMEGPWRTGGILDIFKRVSLEKKDLHEEADQYVDFLSWVVFGNQEFSLQAVKNIFPDVVFCGHDTEAHTIFGKDFVHEVYPGFKDKPLTKDYYLGLKEERVKLCLDTFHLGRTAKGGGYRFPNTSKMIKELGTSVEMLHFQPWRPGWGEHDFLFEGDIKAFLNDKKAAQNPLRLKSEIILKEGNIRRIIIEMSGYSLPKQMEVLAKLKKIVN